MVQWFGDSISKGNHCMVKFLDFKVGLLAGLMEGRKTYALLGGPRDGEVVEFLEGPPGEIPVDGGVYVFTVVRDSRGTLPSFHVLRLFHGYCFTSSGRSKRRLVSFDPPRASPCDNPDINPAIHRKADRSIPRYDPSIALAAFGGRRRLMK